MIHDGEDGSNENAAALASKRQSQNPTISSLANEADNGYPVRE